MSKQIEKTRQLLTLGAVFLFPLIFAGAFTEAVNLPKLIALASLICLALITVAVQIYTTGKIKIAKSKFDIPVILVMLAYAISAVVQTPNKVEAFFLPGSGTLIISLGLLYFLINSIEDKKEIKYTLIASGVALSLLTIANFLGLFEKIPQLPLFAKTSTFNPTGDFLTASIFLATTIPFSIFFLIKEQELAKKLIFAFSLVFTLIAAGISIYTIFSPDKKNLPILPPLPTSWAVAVDTIRESPILGIGPGNYLTSFNRFRPNQNNTYNTDNLWQIKFGGASDWYLTVITETGLFGLIALIFLIATLAKTINKNLSIYKESRSMTIDIVSFPILILLLITFLLIPASFVSILLVFVFLSLNAHPKYSELTIPANASARVIVSLILTGIILFLGFKARPIIQAEAKFKEANDALTQNDGKKSYDLLQQAINLNPYVDRYHAYFAQLNLGLARSISASTQDPKGLTDDQKNTILQLIQQAIREGQNTVSLNPTRAGNWQVLANIYRAIIPYAQQADQFAVSTYNQAINLDPLDPNLRISLGGVYYSLGQYDNAVNAFQFAVYAKPDFANAYYNLSAAYAAKNDFDNAIAAMNQVVLIVPKDSNDAKQAQSDLDTLKKKQQTFQESGSAGTLTTPKKQTETLNPKLQLPQEATPPAGPVIPSPSPIPTGSSSPTPIATPKP